MSDDIEAETLDVIARALSRAPKAERVTSVNRQHHPETLYIVRDGIVYGVTVEAIL